MPGFSLASSQFWSEGARLSLASSVLQEDLCGRGRRAALAQQVDARVQVGLTRGEAFGERQREAGLDQNVQAPALDLGLFVLAFAVVSVISVISCAGRIRDR